MADEMIAYCGIVCTECPAFLAKQTDDNELRKKTVEKWSTDEYPVTEDDINCDGCLSTGHLFMFCNQCDIRSCGTEKSVENCGWCTEYPCEKLEKAWKMMGSPVGRERLDAIHNQKST
ncbi:MAG: DUF3795 domain-containing protein [Theionarchaea archaeon]|nr:DUF3795 domain-containing protein [Theionarchaea archaeon]